MKPVKRFFVLLLGVALTLSMTGFAAYDDSDFYDEEGYARYAGNITVLSEGMLYGGQETQIARAFAIDSGVIRGDADSSLNWDSKLRRVEAAVMIVRLMGLDEEAEAAVSQPSPFTDVPSWANGYINVAYANGVAKGIGGGRFDPDGLCGIQDFITMLFRLTRLEEGKDWSWATALDDFLTAVTATDELHFGTTAWPMPRYLSSDAKVIYDEAVWGHKPLNRAMAADAMWLMLNIAAGPDGESLGDVLSEDYGMSDLLLYDNYVRRTSHGLRAQSRTSVSFTRRAQGGTTTVSVRDGMLSVEADNTLGYEISVATPDGTAPYTGPISLPKEDFAGTVFFQTVKSLGFNDDGEVLVNDGYSEDFYVYYKDGVWSISKWDLNAPETDVSYIYAYLNPSVRRLDEIRLRRKPAEVLPSEYPQEFYDLAARLTAGKQTEFEKAEAISTWVSTHIYYDYPEFRNPSLGDAAVQKRQPETVLETRLAVCDGFANLTGTLLTCAGLESYYESGVTAAPHAWNVAYLDGEWVVMDSTYDSPLSYERISGEGYAGRYMTAESIVEYRTPDDLMEPGVSVGGIPYRYFGLDPDEFYRTHTFPREPLIVTDTVLAADSVAGTWRGNHRVDSY